MLLPVVRTLAEAHGRSVTVDTEYRDGVRIHVHTDRRDRDDNTEGKR